MANVPVVYRFPSFEMICQPQEIKIHKTVQKIKIANFIYNMQVGLMKQDKWKQLPIKNLRGVRQSCSLSFVLLKDYAGRRSKEVNKCQALIKEKL